MTFPSLITETTSILEWQFGQRRGSTSLNQTNDLFSLIDYIAQDDVGFAVRVFNRIRKVCSKLVLFPRRDRVVPELQRQGVTTYRELIVSPWRIVYRVSGTVVYVLAVLDARRNVEDLLLERLVRKNN